MSLRLKKSLQSARKRVLKGPRLDVRAKGMRRQEAEEREAPLVVDGRLLTIPESIIFRALTDLRIPFEVQYSIGDNRTLGGGQADFYLYQHNLIVEYQGPFHGTIEGQARDFFRRVTRQRFGAVDTIYLFEHDLKRIHDRLLEVIGSSGSLRR